MSLPVIIVKLGQPVERFSVEVPPELKPLTTANGQLVSDPHAMRISSPGWEITIRQARFSSVDFWDGLVQGVRVNPHLEYLTLEGAAQLLDALKVELTRAGFQPQPNVNISGNQLMEHKAEIAGDSRYNAEVFRARRANVMSFLVLKKSEAKGAYLGPGLTAQSDLFLLTLTIQPYKP